MKNTTYARVVDGVVVEIVPPSPDFNIEERFVPEFVAELVAVPQGETVEPWYTYEGGVFSPPAPPQVDLDEVRRFKISIVQSHMDTTAQSLGYDNITNAATYADEPIVPKFQEEGRALRQWRSLVWQKCYDILADVESAARPIPTDAELISELPAFPLQTE